MNQGKIIEYIDQGKIICSICLQDKGTRLHLLTPLNRQVNLPTGRILLSSKTSMDPLRPREELLAHLRQAEETREKLKKEIRVDELWELIHDEKERFGYEYLAQLCFGDTIADDHISALVRALFEDKLFFKMKDGTFLPNSKERVDQIRKEGEEEARLEQALKEESAWLKQAIDQGYLITPNKHVIEFLVELALYGKEAPRFRYGRELLQRAGIPDYQNIRHLLVKLGVWEEDEPVDLLRFDIPTSFDKVQMEESCKLLGTEIEVQGYEDLRDLDAFTIDGPFTQDFDDALSWEVRDGYLCLGIHIADVAGSISPGSPIDMGAARRGSSLYLPRRHIPMLPVGLSQDKLSLRLGCDRPVISLLARFDHKGNLYDYRITPSLIHVKRQLTYDQVNYQYINEEPFIRIQHLCEQMRQKRIDQGALVLSLPEPSISIHEDSSISIEMIPQETPSRMIIAECMILYNWLMAKLCQDNDLPILYRGQKKPGERFSCEESDYIYYVFKQRRKIHPLIIDTKPSPHTGLGLGIYTNVSSPIRRYLDLVIQQQVRSFLFGEKPFYNNESLDRIRMQVTPVLRNLNIIKRNRIRYWILKYLQKHSGETFSAVILDRLKTKYRVILKDFLFMVEMKRKEEQVFSPGDHVHIQVIQSEPWDDILKLEFAHPLKDST
ncbi:MAG: RNB domain-containing ribonuclease [Deltaproteobacteria bacterium]|nr:RNB domain-containing ribonuclease [Deltaproteobacteria bacterium]